MLFLAKFLQAAGGVFDRPVEAVERLEEVVSVETLADERMGFVRADITSAHELTPLQRANLEAQVASLAASKVKLRFTTDAALIAGVVARVGSKVYDGSVRGQLDRLRTKLRG